jgi:hypothetical protein
MDAQSGDHLRGLANVLYAFKFIPIIVRELTIQFRDSVFVLVSTSKSALIESVQFTDSQESPPAFQGYDDPSREESCETLKALSGILSSNAQKKFV